MPFLREHFQIPSFQGHMEKTSYVSCKLCGSSTFGITAPSCPPVRLTADTQKAVIDHVGKG